MSRIDLLDQRVGVRRAQHLDHQAVLRGHVVHIGGPAQQELHGVLFAHRADSPRWKRFSLMPASSFRLSRYASDAAQLPLIPRAAAQVARKIGPDLVVGRVVVLSQQRHGVHHKARVAEAALLRALVGDKADKVRQLPPADPPGSALWRARHARGEHRCTTVQAYRPAVRCKGRSWRFRTRA